MTRATAPAGKTPAESEIWTTPVEWLNAVAFGVLTLTVRLLVNSVQSPTSTVSGLPSWSKLTRRHGTESWQFGLAASALSKTSTTTVPASTGRCARVAVTWLFVVMVASSPWTSWLE